MSTSFKMLKILLKVIYWRLLSILHPVNGAVPIIVMFYKGLNNVMNDVFTLTISLVTLFHWLDPPFPSILSGTD